MKKLLLLFAVILLLQSNILAQAPDTLWTKTFGGTDIEVGNSVQQTSDGGYIVAGTKGDSFFGTFPNIYLIKTDSSGDTLWTKKYGGNSSESYGNSVRQTSDGGYIITGTIGDDVCLIKTDSSHVTLWTNTYGGSSSWDGGNSVQQTGDGGYIITGDIGDDVCIIKTDSSGDTLWTKTFGGTDYEAGNSVQQTNDGGYIVAGSTSSFGAGRSDVYLIKTDSSGDTLWTKTFGGTGSDEGKSVQQTSDGGYIVAGSIGGDFSLIKTNSLGDIRWTKIFGGMRAGKGNSVQQTSDGGYICTGSIDGDVCLIKLAPNYVYIYNTMFDKTYYSRGQDTVHISTIIENLNSHQLSARGLIYSQSFGLPVASVELFKDLSKTTSESWEGKFLSPDMEDFFKVSVKVFDQTINDHFIINNAARFTTAGPLKVDGVEYTALSNSRYGIKPILKNEGNSLPISNIKVKLYCNDSWVTEIYPSIRICYDILPGETKLLPLGFSIAYDSSTFPGYFNLEFEMLSDGCLYWRDSSIITLVTGMEEVLSAPSVFSLEQNYPNPFNASTTIKYQIPGQARNDNSFVTLKIYDVLGSEVASLVNQKQKPGNYEIEWNAINQSSGVYFYQLTAGASTGLSADKAGSATGNFVETKKMVLLK